MFHMKTASVRDLRQDFPRILAWLLAGEEVAITLRREAIATLVPRRRKKHAQPSMPDLGGRLQRVFGQRIIPDKTMKAIMDRDRGAL